MREGKGRRAYVEVPLTMERETEALELEDSASLLKKNRGDERRDMSAKGPRGILPSSPEPTCLPAQSYYLPWLLCGYLTPHTIRSSCT
jgi:hypothetical protein